MSDNKRQINGQLIDRAQIETRKAISAAIAKKIPVEDQMRGLLPMPKEIEEQNKLGIELVEWSCDDKRLFIEEFPISKRINPYRFFKTKETNEFFAECVQIANYVCSLHLKQGAIYKEIDATVALALLPTMDGDYRGFILEKIAKKVIEHIKSQQTFTCSWLTQMKEESNEPRTQTDQPVSTETIPESIPESSVP